jgi:tripartite-type tricarboxylate transporter receptor subunit TctC
MTGAGWLCSICSPENKPGASTAIGVVSVSAADPDGHTLLFSGSSSYTVNPAVRTRLGYDPFKQLSPIAGGDQRQALPDAARRACVR